MRGKKIIMGILAMTSLLVGCSMNMSEKELTKKQKIEDFNYLYKTIEENYPFLEVNKRINNIDWLSKKDEYSKKIEETKSDEEFLEKLQEILNELNNGHTHMIADTELFKMVRAVYSTSEGWQKKVQLKALNNKKALKRYNVDKNEKIDTNDMGDLGNKENASVQDILEGEIGYINIPLMINHQSMEQDIKLIDEYLDKIKNYKSLVIDIRGNGGGDSRYWSDYLVPKLIDKDYEYTNYLFLKNGDPIKKYLKEVRKTSKDTVHEIKDLNTEKLVNLPTEVKKDFKYYIKKTSMIKQGKESIKFKGKIYLLVDENVYSSAEKFASFVKETGFATLIGERTGGDGIGSDPLLEMLPNSGYIFRFSKEMGVTEMGVCNEEFKTEPNIIENAKKNEDLLEDNCIERVIEENK